MLRTIQLAGGLRWPAGSSLLWMPAEDRNDTFNYDADQMTTEHEPLAADIEPRLARDYPSELLSAVLGSLAKYQDSERNRVIRCIIHLSGGDAQRIPYFVGVAARDYRDVILWAEYDAKDRQLHDFSKPFVQT